jgi:hypothetical protein
MIVRDFGERLQLITQPDHARLAGRIMERCAPLMTRPRRDVILRAIAEHDNGWTEEDAAPTVDPTTGRIADFVHAPVSMRQRVWPRAVQRLAETPWAAALVAQHAITVYGRYRSDPEWTSFFAGLASSRDALLAVNGGSLTDLLDDYTFVRLADLISLAFCTGWTDEHTFGHWIVRLSGSEVTVTPGAFGGATVPFELTAREVHQSSFHSDADLHRALTHARAVTLTGTVA